MSQQFDRESVKKWRRAVHKELRWLGAPSEDLVYRAAMVCATVFCFGTDADILAELSGQDEKLFRTVLKRLRKMRVLVGQTLRASDGWQGKYGNFGLMLDAMVAAGDLYRPPDEKRSAAQKARRNPESRKPRSPRQAVTPGTRPKVVNSNPLYGLAEWEKQQ